MSAKLLKRVETLAKVGGLKVMVSANFTTLPLLYKRWKNYRNKEKLQFLHVLPCRCGSVLSKTKICTCSEHVINTYTDRNRRHYYEEEYGIFLKLNEVDLEEYEGLDEVDISGIKLEKFTLDHDAKQTLDYAIKRFIIRKEMVIRTANVIANLNNHLFKDKSTVITRAHILEALSYKDR